MKTMLILFAHILLLFGVLAVGIIITALLASFIPKEMHFIFGMLGMMISAILAIIIPETIMNFFKSNTKSNESNY